MLSLRFIQQASAVCCSRSSYMHFRKADLSLQDTTLQAALIHSQRSVSRNKHSLILLQTAGETFFPPRDTSLNTDTLPTHHHIYIHTHTHILTSITFHSSSGVCSGTNATSALSPHYSTFFSPSTQGLLGVFPPLYLLPGLGDPAALPRGPVRSRRGRRGTPGRSRGRT